MKQQFTPEQVQRMCTEKRVYADSRSEAKMLARGVGRRYGRTFKVYRCKVCGAWHITTKRGAQ